ncbi:MAG TPA: S1 RNA-binding domain-containing protein [Desulfosalsimonadaceae bacterium]|nr:S1 RNA-binding domain-containing protein [Desulfosalsimonadaceae bacterium]
MYTEHTEYSRQADSFSRNDSAEPGLDEFADMSGEDLMAMYEQTFKEFKAGEILEGEIVDIDNERVLIDIGYKTEGEVPKAEFLDDNREFHLNIGDRVEVVLVYKDEDGYPVLSRRGVEDVRRLDDLQKKYETGETVTGKIVSRKKGGFIVEVGITAFLPASQLDVKRINDFDAWVDTEHEFKVLQFDRKSENVVLSRRALLEAAYQREKEAAIKRIHKGDVLEGTINNITDYGLFVDLGGIVGLAHVSNLSWTPPKHPAKLYEAGEQVSVKVLDVDEDSMKVTLGIKQLMPNPWDTLHERYPVGSVIEGKVKKVTDFGVFVAIEEGINGLVHVSDISWTEEIKSPAQHYKRGDTVTVKILDIDRENQRVRLGIKQLYPHPWEEVARNYLPGTPVTGEIINITSFGLFTEIEEGVQGLVHISEIPAKKGENPLDWFEEGQTIEARVIEVLPEEKKIRLTLKPEPENKGELGQMLREKFAEKGAGRAE